MSLARILILAGAALSAIFAAILVNGAGSKTSTTTTPQHVEAVAASVLVAARDIEVGQKIAPEDLAWKVWPADGISAGMLNKQTAPKGLETVAGAYSRTMIPAGAPLFPNQYVKSGEANFMAAVLSPGARAAALPIAEENAAGGFVLPGDRVDVVLTREIDTMASSPTGGGQQTRKVVTSTILKNVKVLAIDQTYKGFKEGDALKGATATLELFPNQVEKLEQAKKQGTVSLALRSVGGAPSDVAVNAAADREAQAEDGEQTRTAIRMHGYAYTTEASTDQ